MRCIGLSIFLLFSFSVQAQFQGQVYEQSTQITVNHQNLATNAAWCGGLNATEINHADINNDGKNDLVIYDYYNSVVRTFINIGGAGEMKYSYQPKYEHNFSIADNYLILKDYNCDGIADAFVKGSGGVLVYKGSFVNNELKFTLYKPLYYPSQTGPVNVYVQPTDIPSIEDIDGDGDLDIFGYEVNGFFLTYYQNRRVEDGLPCDSIRMIQVDKCWGKFYQGVYRTVNTNITCKGVEGSNKMFRHPKNASLHIDMDNDGDWDLFNGNTAYADVQLYFNNGNNIINDQDTLYNKNGHQLRMPYWPAPHWFDIDNDGDKDLIFTCHNDDQNSANYLTMSWYKNIGNATTASYNYVTDTLLMKDMIDVGSYSHPVFYDYDKDGKMDIFIGSEGYYNNYNDTVLCTLAYYHNNSSGTTISFEKITNDFLNLSTKNYKSMFPTFGDITGDGIDDLILGNAKGNFIVYKNIASSNTVQGNFLWMTDSLSVPSPGKYSTPLVYDIDVDGKTDLISGNEVGQLVYYRDTSINTVKHLKRMTTSWGNVKAGAPWVTFGHSVPLISRTDNLMKEYLLVGTSDGTIERYDSFLNNSGSFKKIDSNYSLISTPSRSVPAIADLDHDGMYEMIVGNKLGGLLLYKQAITVGTPSVNFSNIGILLFPNPCRKVCLLDIQDDESKYFNLRIRDLTGRICHSEIVHGGRNRLNVEVLTAGMYTLTVEGNNQKKIEKLIIE